MVDRVPETSYTRSGDVHIAYQVFGDGPIDVVFVPGWVSHLEWNWEYPPYAALLRRLGSFARVITFDKRGIGLSDRPARLPTLDDQMDDVGAVMDAAGSERAALFTTNDGGALGLMYAASHPDRVRALALFAALARFVQADDWPDGVAPELVDYWMARIDKAWGRDNPDDMAVLAPTMIDDEVFRRWYAKLCRLGASPSAVIELLRVWTLHDMRGVLSSVQVPTLVVCRSGSAPSSVASSRYLAAHIGGARLAEPPGFDSLLYAGDGEVVIDEVQEFFTGARDAPQSDRVLATVMFTDIVGSTAQAATLGDWRWQSLLDAHDQVVDDQLIRFRGRKVHSTGDGLLATFDRPARAIECAMAIVDRTHAFGIDVRAGLHTGEVDIRGDDLGGLAVHIGARVASAAAAGEVLVSRTLTDLVAGSGIQFEDRGDHELRGVPGSWRLYAVSR